MVLQILKLGPMIIYTNGFCVHYPNFVKVHIDN